MIKNLRNKAKNKKGFTLVELIVVIVIIIVLAAVLVPTVLKYIEQANEANCKQEGATTLVQLQADVADHYASSAQDAFSAKKIGKATGVATYSATPTANQYTYTLVTDKTKDNWGEITEFSYGNAKYYITWTKDADWTGPTKRTKAAE